MFGMKLKQKIGTVLSVSGIGLSQFPARDPSENSSIGGSLSKSLSTNNRKFKFVDHVIKARNYSKLVPVKLRDKNGKLVTRWISFQRLSAEQKEKILQIIIEKNKEQYREIPFNEDSWKKEFPNLIVKTPIGNIKIGEGQYHKMVSRARISQMGLVRPTLERPAIVFKDSKEGIVFLKLFVKDSNKIYFVSVVYNINGININVSNHKIEFKRFLKKIMSGEVLSVDATGLPSATGLWKNFSVGDGHNKIIQKSNSKIKFVVPLLFKSKDYSRLIPVKVQDKNGNIVTRWVNPDDHKQIKLITDSEDGSGGEEGYFSKLRSNLEKYQVKPLIEQTAKLDKELANKLAVKYKQYPFDFDTMELDLKLDCETIKYLMEVKKYPKERDRIQKEYDEKTLSLAKQISNRKIAMLKLYKKKAVQVNGVKGIIVDFSKRGFPVVDIEGRKTPVFFEELEEAV